MLGAVDPIFVLSPFLAILRAPYLSGPYKSAALDAIHTFVTCDILLECPDKTGDALADLVDAVTRLNKYFSLIYMNLLIFDFTFNVNKI